MKQENELASPPGHIAEGGKKSFVRLKPFVPAIIAPLHAQRKSNPTEVDYFKDIVATIREPLVVLDTDLRVLSANRSFYKFFAVKPRETIGNLIYDLGNRQWDIPALRDLLESILPQKAVFNDFEVEHEFPFIGRRILLLNARQIPGPPKDPHWILLAFEDNTARKQLERIMQSSEERFQLAFENANDCMLLVDLTSGQVLNSNQSAQKLLGYSNRALLKKSLWEFGFLKDRLQYKQTVDKVEKQGFIEFYNTTIQTSKGGHFPADFKLMDRAKVIQCNFRDIGQRMQAEEEIRNLALFPEENPAPVLRVRQDGILLYANPAGQLLFPGFGCKTGKRVEKFWGDLVNETYASKVSKTVDIQLDHRVWSFYLVPVMDKGYVNMYGTDITERKQAEEALQENEEKYRNVVERANDGIAIIQDTVVKYLNPRLVELWGGTVEEIIGEPFADFIHPDERAAVLDLYQQRMVGEDVIPKYETALQRKDGNKVYVEINAGTIKFQGEPADLAIIRDITERRLTMEELRLSEEKYRILVDEVNDGFYVSDGKGVFTFANPALARIYGVESPQVLIGRKFADFLGPGGMPAVLEEAYSSSMQTGSVQEIMNGQIIRPDGTCAFIEFKPTMIVKGNQILGTRGVVRDITERKHREEAIRSRTEELTTLYQLSRALSDANSLENVIELVTRHAVESVRSTFAFILLLEGGDLVSQPIYPIRNLGHDFNKGDRRPLTALPICQRVLNINEPVVLQAGSAELSSAERDALLLDFAQTTCLVPLRVGNPSQHLSQSLGLLILGEAREEKREPFTPEKIRMARSIGDQAASAIRRLLLREQAGRRLKQLTALREIDRMITSSFDLRVSLELILKHVSEQLETDAADVLVFNDRLQTLEFAAGCGFHSPASDHMQLRLGQSQAGRAALERQIVQIPDVAASRVAFAQSKLMNVEQFAAYFAVPLITKGQVEGVLEIYHRTPLIPNEEWLDFLNTLAGQAAIAIDNVHLFENLQRSNVELLMAYDATIEGWSHALDLRDKETEGHTLRVAEMAVNLARVLGLSEENLRQVRWGGLLHDIGKMGIPDSILLKPGPLTDAEWMVMKRHPRLAYDLLSPISYLHGALDIPYCHHEMWDGTGYPRGLIGEQIPLVARIFTVVDVWDALTSDRPYRKAWSKEKTIEHIKASSGTHFDPQVVKTFFLEHEKK